MTEPCVRRPARPSEYGWEPSTCQSIPQSEGIGWLTSLAPKMLTPIFAVRPHLLEPSTALAIVEEI